MQEKLENKHGKDKNYCKVRDHCHYAGKYRGAVHSISNLENSVTIKIPIAFQNGSNYDYFFIIKELAEEFRKISYFFSKKYQKIPNLCISNGKISYKN